MNQVPATVVQIRKAQDVRGFCVLLVINAVVPYRSIPRILDLLQGRMTCVGGWLPHFTSVINWTLRLGLGLLKQVKPVCESWVAIMDHSIDIGTKKALVVLRVPMDALVKRGSAIQLQDCECIGVTVSEKANGENIAIDLENIFCRAGRPAAIIKDRDYTLQKGVRLYIKKQMVEIPVVEDIGHVVASALRDQFEKTSGYKQFATLISHAAKRLRQTNMAFLIPPKLRTKGRFQSISTLGKWANKMLEVLGVKGRAKKGGELARLRAALPGFARLKPFIKEFANTTAIASKVMEVLKNRGLNRLTHEQCSQLADQLPLNCKVKARLKTWLQHHIEIQTKLTPLPLLVSSDIIESLFGRFKHAIERSPQADMNRTTLLIPALCGRLDETKIAQALILARHNDLKIWEEQAIPYTVRKKRQAFFGKNEIQKPGNLESA